MLAAGFLYSFANARARGIRSRRLSSEDWHFLVSAKEAASFAAYLLTTPYGKFFDSSLPATVEKAPPGRQLYRMLLEDYAILARALEGRRVQTVINALAARFVGENFKVYLRYIFSGRDVDVPERLLYPGPWPSHAGFRISWSALRQAGSVEEFVRRLSKTPFGPGLKYALPQFQSQGRLFPLEITLDKTCFKLLHRAVSMLSCKERRAVKAVIGAYVDLENILWIIRFHASYGFKPEEIINYTVPGGLHTGLSEIRHFSKAATPDEFASLMPGDVLPFIKPDRGWAGIEQGMRKWLLKVIERVISGPPFSPAVEVAVLLEEELESDLLLSLLEAKLLSGDKAVAGDFQQHVKSIMELSSVMTGTCARESDMREAV